jgi:excisionase family DNA binding protein
METNLPQLLTPQEVAEWLRLPSGDVERMAGRGEVPAIELPGGELVFDAGDLAQWIETRKSAGGPPAR